MIKSKKITFIIVFTFILGVTINSSLLLQSRHHVAYKNAILTDETLITSVPIEVNPSDKTIPRVYNLPLDINWLQALKLRMFLSQFEKTNNLTTTADAYYRENSIKARSSEVSVLVDIPSIKQTLYVKVAAINNTLEIGCGVDIDQKEASWVCSDESLGESE